MNRSGAEQLQQRNRELSILNTIARALNSSVDLTETLQAALAQVAGLLDLKTGWVWLLHEESGASYLAAAQNLPPALARDPEKMTGSCYCLRTYRDGDLAGAANVNVVECSRLQGLVDGTDGLRYHASIPLYAHGKKLGVMNVASTDWRRLSADDLRLLYTIGDLLSIAIERARLFNRSAQIGALEERNRLARELHDTLAQGLTAISLQLESADALLEDSADTGRAHDALHHALALTRANLEEVRRSVLDLRAAPLEGRTLVQALADLAAQSAVPATFTLRGDERPLPLRVETGIYRIAQEALRNVERHANAAHARMELALTPDELHLLVEDDGEGFDVAAVEKGRFGLIGMSERARLLGGRLEINTSPQAGTQLQVVVPIK
jgi:two-component system NarL family sensor kinase